MTDFTSADTVILICGLIGILWGLLQLKLISLIDITGQSDEGASQSLTANTNGSKSQRLIEIYTAIADGANSFLYAEYKICGFFMIIFGAVVYALIYVGADDNAFLEANCTTIAFLMGAATSIVSGYIGMTVAVYSNVRTTIAAQRAGWTDCFNVAFRAGAVMGYLLCSLGLLILWVLLRIFSVYYAQSNWVELFEAISGYGLGGSSIAMFGRVGGGIYTKAADVGADLVGKVVHGIPEDDPRNPATIADNVGDNVGDVAGMGADLFGSFAESTCACLVVASKSDTLKAAGWECMMYPLVISAAGLIVCMITSLLATHVSPVKKEEDIELVLKVQLIVTTFLSVIAGFAFAKWYLPDTFQIAKFSTTESYYDCNWYYGGLCVMTGAVGGLIIGIVTEYFTSHSYAPVRDVADSCKTGAATNIIYGLALGYKSSIIPIFVLALIIYCNFSLCGMYGVALGAIGMLSTLATGLTIDAYGPVCDNAGGIAEMAELPEEVREKTDALDAAGNTTAAIGKGFAIGSAALVSLALFGAFATRLEIDSVNLLEPITFAFILIGANLPYWFSAMTMKSVGEAAMEMVNEVQRQFEQNPALLNANTTERPDYDRCIQISTNASLREMIAPGALVMLSPLVTGTLFGTYAVCGVLTGGLVSGIQLAISMSNTGGAWDNAKKYIEKAKPGSDLGGKGSSIHKAAVVGDTVGDPLKDTSGPALNILMKLMAIISLVFASYFDAINDGSGLLNISVADQ